MTQRKKSITIHETRSVVDITSILTQFGRWAALVLIVTGDGNCIQYREVNTCHRTQYTSQKKSKWKQNDNSALWTMWSSKRFANTIIVMMHYSEHHLHSTTQRRNWPQKSRNRLFFSPYNSNPIKNSKPNATKKPAAWRNASQLFNNFTNVAWLFWHTTRIAPGAFPPLPTRIVTGRHNRLAPACGPPLHCGRAECHRCWSLTWNTNETQDGSQDRVTLNTYKAKHR